MTTVSYTTQNQLLLNNLMEFYKDETNLNRMLKIITGNSKISLRIVDWFATNYSKKNYVVYNIKKRNGDERRFKVYIDYKLNETEDDIIRETATIDWPSAQDRFTQVTVQFDTEAENFKPDSVTWPPTEAAANSVYQTYLSEDNNNPLTTSVSPSGITTKYHALAYAEQQVRKSRLI